jgi:hypothetical protein
MVLVFKYGEKAVDGAVVGQGVRKGKERATRKERGKGRTEAGRDGTKTTTWATGWLPTFKSTLSNKGDMKRGTRQPSHWLPSKQYSTKAPEFSNVMDKREREKRGKARGMCLEVFEGKYLRARHKFW